MITAKDLPETLNECDVIAFWKVGEPWGCFSNWYPAKVDDWPTSEHAMTYGQAVLFNDMETAYEIAEAKTPAEAKALGRKIKNFDSIVWDKYKTKIVLDVLTKKFTQNETLKTILLSTDNKVLIEASPLDNVWGIGIAANDKHIYHPYMWAGQNLLGFCLMDIKTLGGKKLVW